MIATIYLLSAVLVGLLAAGRRGGFLLYFVISLVVSPIIGLFLLLVATQSFDRRCRRDEPGYPRADRP